jgi:hypothetical protein
MSEHSWTPEDRAHQLVLQRAVDAKLAEGPTGRLAPREEVNAARSKVGLPDLTPEEYAASVERRRIAAGRQPIVFPPPRPVEVPPDYPYIVVRVIAGVYQREDIAIEEGEPCIHIGHRCSYVRHPEPFTDTGQISPGCREFLIRGVLDAVQRFRLRMCLVWARGACTFCERDGTALDSNDPPSGGFGSGGRGGTKLPFNIEFDRRDTHSDDGTDGEGA